MVAQAVCYALIIIITENANTQTHSLSTHTSDFIYIVRTKEDVMHNFKNGISILVLILYSIS